LPIYRHFYVERRKAAGWVVPPDFAPEPWTFDCDHSFGGFAWAHPRNGWTELFWGAEALFPMRPGPPEDRRGSALLQYLDQFYDYGRDDGQLCWLPYSDLMINSWETEWVTVGAWVPARYALLFENGRQGFPWAALRGAGASEMELERLRNGSLAPEPLDVAFGRQRFQIAKLAPERPVDVTWRATISEFIGEPHASVFKGLRRYGPDEDLRILSRRA
jgi:hypothetical protein